jgi:hypothetical protein
MNRCALHLLVVFVLFLTGCPKKQKIETSAVPQTEVGLKMEPAKPSEKKSLYSKELRESLYFAASLEREALRLITKNKSFELATLFSVLSFAFEIHSGTKKMAPSGIDCTRFRIVKQEKELKIFKTCQKPEVLIATLNESLTGAHYDINFKTKEWSAVVGLSVALTGSDISC